MKKLFAIMVLALGFCLSAHADVWKWVDVYGKSHFVDTMKPIYTWLDESGKIHYSDKPDHVNAISVELMWHSAGDLDETEGNGSTVAKREKEIDPNESVDQRNERESAEAYNCKRATEIYDSYLKAPQLYKTGADGEKVYLSAKEAEAMIAETKTKVAALCE